MGIRIFGGLALTAILATSSGASFAAPVYLNIDNISVSVGSGTGAGTSNNTFNGGQTIDKVIDAPSATASEDHNQTTHIWYTFSDPTDGLELVFDFGVSYDITTLHFWNYAFDNFSVDSVDFSFFDSLDQLIGQQTIMPLPSGSESNITAQDYALLSPINTRSVTAFLTGTNGEVDFQNIGFTANTSDPDLDPAPNVVPLPASIFLLLGGFVGLGLVRRRKAS